LPDLGSQAGFLPGPDVRAKLADILVDLYYVHQSIAIRCKYLLHGNFHIGLSTAFDTFTAFATTLDATLWQPSTAYVLVKAPPGEHLLKCAGCIHQPLSAS
jgi:hypothetical protein